MATKKTSLHEYFGSIPDHRIERNKKHQLIDIIILSVLAVLSGAESWESIVLYGREKEKFIRKILSLPNGIPSHDTINRVFCAIKPQLIEDAFIKWVASIKNTDINTEVIAFDGKCIRGSKDSFHQQSAIYMVSAFASKNRLVLGQVKVNEKSNEITAIPELLDLIDVKGNIVSIDAIGTQTDIAQKIIEKEANYILAVKGNQKGLEKDVLESFKRLTPVSIDEQVDKGHGRLEIRKCEVVNNIRWIEEPQRWPQLASLVKITSTRIIKNKTETEERYYISSLKENAVTFNSHIRSHWSIENTLHWTLDMVFDEDWQRKRQKYAAQNFSFIRKIAFNLLKQDDSKGSMVSKRLKAGWSNDFLMSLLKI